MSSDFSRLAAAHHLAALSQQSQQSQGPPSAALSALLRAISSPAEASSRAAMYGLAISGAAAVPSLLDLLALTLTQPHSSNTSSFFSHTIAHALGNAACAYPLPPPLLAVSLLALSSLITSPPSPSDLMDVTRATAAEALGPMLQRHASSAEPEALASALSALLRALEGGGALPLPRGGGEKRPLQEAAAFSLLQVVETAGSRYYLLTTTHYSLLTTHYLLPTTTTYYLPLTTCYLLLTTYYLLLLLTTYYLLLYYSLLTTLTY